MSPMNSDMERLKEHHYIGTMDQGRNCAFRIESERFEKRLQAHGGNFCVILRVDGGEADDYFVIPYQVLADVLAAASPTGLVGDPRRRGWGGTIADHTTLTIQGGRFDVQVGSCYQNARLLQWLIDGNDLFSFTLHRADEAASGWSPYEPPGSQDAERLKSLLDDPTKQPGRRAVARDGQAEFREALRQRYGDRCMVSGCPLIGVVEAAHIVPYSKTSDHHPANGLLLRADIHALFDLHMLGIEPESLTVSVHSVARWAGYGNLDALTLQVANDLRPSHDALELRWRWFEEGR
jgi:hypothetical protein